MGAIFRLSDAMPITLTLKGNTFHGLMQNVRENYFVPGYKPTDTQCAGIVLSKLVDCGEDVAIIGYEAVKQKNAGEAELLKQLLLSDDMSLEVTHPDTIVLATLLGVQFRDPIDCISAMMYGLEQHNWHSLNDQIKKASLITSPQ